MVFLLESRRYVLDPKNFENLMQFYKPQPQFSRYVNARFLGMHIREGDTSLSVSADIEEDFSGIKLTRS